MTLFTSVLTKARVQLDHPKPFTPTATTPLIATPARDPSVTSVSRSETTAQTVPNVALAPVIPAVKNKFQDLDAFLNSDSEEDEESSEERYVI